MINCIFINYNVGNTSNIIITMKVIYRSMKKIPSPIQ